MKCIGPENKEAAQNETGCKYSKQESRKCHAKCFLFSFISSFFKLLGVDIVENRMSHIPTRRCSPCFLSPGREVSITVSKAEHTTFPSSLDQPRSPGTIDTVNIIPPYTQSRRSPESTALVKKGISIAEQASDEIQLATIIKGEEKVLSGTCFPFEYMLLKLSTLQVRQQLYEGRTRRFVLRSR